MTERKLSPPDEFDKELRRGAEQSGIPLTSETAQQLGDYFRLVTAWNARLHLVAPCTPAQFASRHVLESLAALPFLTSGAAFIDLGSGAGLPAIPCLVMRPGLSATLIEASRKKAVFLREAAARLNLSQRVEVVAERFEKVEPPAADALTCRAIERFAEILPAMAAWAIAVPRLLLFGGASVGESIERANLSCERILLTGSEQRFLFVVNRAEANPER